MRMRMRRWRTGKTEWVTAGTVMASSPSHLVCLFVVTSGQNAELLGIDEEQIVVFAYALYDIANNKVSDTYTQWCCCQWLRGQGRDIIWTSYIPSPLVSTYFNDCDRLHLPIHVYCGAVSLKHDGTDGTVKIIICMSHMSVERLYYYTKLYYILFLVTIIYFINRTGISCFWCSID